MTEPRPGSREDILRALLCGDLAEDHTEVRKLFLRDPRAREEFERLRRLEAQLLETPEVRARVLEESGAELATNAARANEDDLVAGFLAHARGQAGPDGEPAEAPRPRLAARPWVKLLAAGVVVALGVFAVRALLQDDSAGWELQYLNGGDAMILDAADLPFGTLAWQAPFEFVRHYNVRAYALADGDRRGELLAEQERLEATRWSLPGDVVGDRRAIYWEVEAIGPGVKTELARAVASR